MSKLVGVGLGWGCIQAGVVLFQDQILTGVILVFHLGEVLFKSGVAFKRIRYVSSFYADFVIIRE